MENKQTAVEWLIEELLKYDKLLDGRRKHNDATIFKLNPTKIYEQAKQMEKEQIIDAYVGNNDDEFGLLINIKDMAEQYYNETYGKDNE